MTWALLGLGWLTLLGGVGAVFYVMRREIKRMGAVEEREKTTYRKIEGSKKANEAKDEVNKLSDSAVSDWLRKWHRR